MQIEITRNAEIIITDGAERMTVPTAGPMAAERLADALLVGYWAGTLISAERARLDKLAALASIDQFRVAYKATERIKNAA